MRIKKERKRSSLQAKWFIVASYYYDLESKLLNITSKKMVIFIGFWIILVVIVALLQLFALLYLLIWQFPDSDNGGENNVFERSL